MKNELTLRDYQKNVRYNQYLQSGSYLSGLQQDWENSYIHQHKTQRESIVLAQRRADTSTIKYYDCPVGIEWQAKNQTVNLL